MTNKWVGWIACLLLLVASFGATGASAEYRERFIDPEEAGWVPVAGEVTYGQTQSWGGYSLEWLQLDAGTETARVHVDPALVNTTWSQYELTAVLERDPGAGSSDWIGLTFGEDEQAGYHLVAFDDQSVQIGEPNGANSTAIVADQQHWGDVPEGLASDGVDQRLRYTLAVAGTTLTVKINGWHVLTHELPISAIGHFGVAASAGTSLHTQEVLYKALDVQPPSVEIYRPQDATLYLDDTAVPLAAGGPIVLGELTLGADIFDPLLGVKNARLFIDGEYVPGSEKTETGPETRWTIDTTQLGFGYHNFTIRAQDNAGNRAEDSVEVLVISEHADGGSVGDVADAATRLLP